MSKYLFCCNPLSNLPLWCSSFLEAVPCPIFQNSELPVVPMYTVLLPDLWPPSSCPLYLQFLIFPEVSGLTSSYSVTQRSGIIFLHVAFYLSGLSSPSLSPSSSHHSSTQSGFFPCLFLPLYYGVFEDRYLTKFYILFCT